MRDKYDPSALWVALNELGSGNIFQVYPRLLQELLLQEEAARQEGDTSEAEKLVLPSDREWRTQQYFYLVDLQKTLDIEQEEDADKLRKFSGEPSEEWAPWSLVVASKTSHAPPPVAVTTVPGPAWDIAQVLKAACLLNKPPLKVEFSDEEEMRRVYSLIYDVFRYKTILEQVLDDTDFFGDFPQHADKKQTVWLFLMELTRRRWGARARGEVERATQLLAQAGPPYTDIESSVWDQRVHFAAAIARIRIKKKAFALCDLLPPHLKEERMTFCVNKETVTGWVNTFKAKKVATLVKRLHELGYSYSGSRQLCAGEYRFDRVCPRFITLRAPSNKRIGQMELVKDGVIVLQEREFCEGASTLCRALRANSLRGVVAQTHASSPRCSAYLAAQLRELAAVLRAKAPAAPATPQLGKLVVFGAGDKVSSYIGALRELGIEASEESHSGAPVCVISEPVHCDTPTVASALDGVVAVLATPPNSYSAVTDPIDLVCGRGGDLALLEILTESEIDTDGKERVQSILEEQKRTLKTLLSKPQIQLILYETHSALEAENQAQVTRAVAEANRLARERHAMFKRRTYYSANLKKDAADPAGAESMMSFNNTVQVEVVAKEDARARSASRPQSGFGSMPGTGNILCKTVDRPESNSRPSTSKSRPIPDVIAPMPRDPDDDITDVHVPDCDLFEVQTLPTLGNGLDINYILDRDGCYLGLIQRKEITRLDAKYMIRVAEERGLFGAAAAPPQRRKKTEHTTVARKRKTKGSFEVERIAAPTYASMVRSTRRGSAPPCTESTQECSCLRHERRQAAASAFCTTACTCDAKHRPAFSARRGTSMDAPAPLPTTTPRSPPPCRRPFPVVVNDLRLSGYQAGAITLSPRKIRA